jgi:hypothetical protein
LRFFRHQIQRAQKVMTGNQQNIEFYQSII